MRHLLLLCVLVAAAPAVAQEADTLTVEDGWVRRLTAALAVSQAASRDWQEGGVDALAATALVEGEADRLAGRVRIHHDARVALGVVQQDTLPLRKADDQVRYGMSAEWRLGGLRPTLALTAQSQLAPGYDVSPDSSDYPTLVVVPGQALRVSALGSPALLTQSVGLTVRPGGGVVARAGLALKETVVSSARLRPLYGNAPGEAVRLQAGVDAEVRLERPLAPLVRLRARANAFQAFNQVGNEAPDLRAELTLALRAGRLFQVTLDGAALYDADVIGQVQMRQTLAVGLTLDVL